MPRDNFFETNINIEDNEFNTVNEVNNEEMSCPIMEMPKERVCHKYIYHDVAHVIPCNTRIINHHIYRHNYIPKYTCCEENECMNVYGPKCF